MLRRFVVRFPAPDHLRLVAVADDWAAGRRVVLQHRTTDGWTQLATRRFSPRGARWHVPASRPGRSHRAVTRVKGERYVFRRVTFSD